MWSKEFEYREQKNIGGQQFSAVFTFDKIQFESEEFQAKARELFWDDVWISYYERKVPEIREIMINKIENLFPKGINIFFHSISEPFSQDNKGYFKVVGDHEPLPKQPHNYFLKKGYRTIEFTNQESIDKMKNYKYIQSMTTFIKDIFKQLHPIYGYLDRYNYIYSFKLQKDPRDYVFGLTFYGQEMVEQIGREKLLSAPEKSLAYAVEEFDNGGVMLQIHENPVSYIKWPYRKKIMDYLGLQPRKIAPPQVAKPLQQLKPPTNIRIPTKRESLVVVGLNARDLEVAEGLSLRSYFNEQILPKVRSNTDVADGTFALAKWFNGTDTGLTAYVSGTMYGGNFEVFIGQNVGRLEGYQSWKKELEPDHVETVCNDVAEKLKALGISTQPEIHCLLYDVEG